MQITKIDIDSEAIGKTVLELKDFSSEFDFIPFENSYIREYEPFYVLFKCPVEDLANIHCAQTNGFQFIELQIKMTHKLKKKYPVSKQFEFSEVSSLEDVKTIQDIAAKTFDDDRLAIDPSLDNNMSEKRYSNYIQNSFDSEDQKLFKLTDKTSGKIVAFKTHKYLENKEVLLLLGGVKPELKNLGIGLINGFAELNELQSIGIKQIYTHISARNYPIMNMEISAFGFRVLQSYVVLRKLYQ